MAFTAALNAITQSDQAINLDITYADSVTGWTKRDNIQYADGSGVTLQQIKTDVTVRGNLYKQTLATSTTLKSYVGTVITI